jgi:hypothetical protein
MNARGAPCGVLRRSLLVVANIVVLLSMLLLPHWAATVISADLRFGGNENRSKFDRKAVNADLDPYDFNIQISQLPSVPFFMYNPNNFCHHCALHMVSNVKHCHFPLALQKLSNHPWRTTPDKVHIQ